MSWVRFWKRGCLPAVCTILALRPTAVAAAQPTTHFTLSYSAPATCPSREAFVQAVSMRAPTAQQVSTAEGATLALEVRLDALGDQAKGILAVRHSDGQSSLREVPQAPCAEVAESMAIIVAMLLEQLEFRVEATKEPAAGTSGEPEPQPVTALAPQKERRPDEPAPARASVPSARRPSAPALSRAHLRLAGSFATVLESEASPSPAPGLSAGVEGSWDRKSHWSPSVHLAAYQIDAGLEVTPAGSARFRLRALRLSACPLRWFAHPRLSVRACAAFDAGELWVRGENVDRGKTLTMPWFGAGVAGRFEVRVLPLLSLETGAALQALYRHDEFVFEPNSFGVHSVAPVTLGVSLGLVLRTP